MLKAYSLLLLTLVLNVQLCSSAPIPAKVVQSSAVAKVPGPKELAPVPEDHSYVIEKKKSIKVKLISVAAGNAAPSSVEPPPKEDIPVVAKEPEPVFIGDQVSNNPDKTVSAPQEPLAAAPQESAEEETVSVEAAFAEASPDKITEEIATAVAVKSESPEQHYVEDPAPEALIPVIPLEASEDEAPEENAEAEAAPEELLLVFPDDDTKVEEEPFPLTPEKELSVVLVPAELETKEAGRGEAVAGETAPEGSVREEPAVIVPVEPTELESTQEEQEETVPIILSETKEEEAPGEHAKEEEAVAPVVLEENAEGDLATNEEPLPSTLERDESVTIFPTELEGQVEPAIEETIANVSVPEEPAVIVSVEPAEQGPTREEQAVKIPIILSETKEEEAPEEHAKEEAEVSPVVPEENAEVDPATNEELLPNALEEGESVTLFPMELEGQEELTVEETAPEEPAVIVPMGPSEQESAQEEAVPIILSETKEEEAPEEHTKEEEAVASVVLEGNAEGDPPTNEEPLPSTLEEGESVTLFPKELEGQEEPAAGETVPQESVPEDSVVTVPLDPGEEEPELEEQVKEESIPIASPEEPDAEALEKYTVDEEENVKQDQTINEEPLSNIPEEDESVVHAELDTKEEVQEEATAEETAPEKPAVIVLVEPTSEEPAPEDPILITSPEDPEKDAPENNTEEEVVQSDPLQVEAELEEDTAPQENGPDDSEAEILVTSVTETRPETETIETLLDPGKEVPVAATEVHVATPEPVTAHAPAATDAQAEIVPSPVDGGVDISKKTHTKDFKAAVKLIEEEPEALLNRGALLGAAFFTLVLFIAIGVVWTTISKKLR